MSKIKVNEIVNRNGSSITIGDANTSTVAINSGTTLTGFTSTGIDDNATSTAITIDSSGKVGIGTSSQTRKLTVTGGEVEIRDGNYFMMRPSGNAWDMRLQAVSTRLDVVSGGDTANPIATFVHGGNVGIGTTSPTDLLDVRGSIKARDASDNVGRFHTRNAFTVTNGTAVQLTSVCGSAIVCVSCNTTGAGGLFWGTFSTSVSKLAGDGLTSDSGTSDIAVYKSSSSNLMYFKNRSGFSRDYVITVYAARHA